MNKLGLIFFPAFDYSLGKNHPEREERLLYTKDQLEEEGLFDFENIVSFNPSLATIKDISRVHFIPDYNVIDKSHYISSGASIKALDLVMKKEVDKSFALTRPPGHHAMRVVYGDRGFCVVNNVAVMIESIRAKYGNLKIAIIDTDCHHGDGTEEIFYNDKNTLFVSVHQDGRTLYPGTGFTNELGGPSAYGYNINIPLPPYTNDNGYLYVVDNIIKPILNDFKPDLIINSAGQDNHFSDPLTNMNVTARGYAKLNEKLDFDCLVLEGGYSVTKALPYVNMAIILAMINEDYSNVIEPDLNENILKEDNEIMDYIKKLKYEILYNWNNKDELRVKKFGNEKIIKESKKIYYDTSNILEHQYKEYHLCDSCSGLEYISSTSDKGDKIFAVIINRDVCNKCHEIGTNKFNDLNKREYTNIFLQDKLKDKYLKK